MSSMTSKTKKRETDDHLIGMGKKPATEKS